MKKHNFNLKFDRIISGGSWKQITVFIVVILSVFFIFSFIILLFGKEYIGYNVAANESDFWQLYYFFADPGSQSSINTSSNSTRVIGMIMSTLGSIFLGGILISTITNIIERRVEKYRKGRNYYMLSDHIVIIGSDQMVYGIVKQLSNTDVDNIVVMTSKDVEELRNSLKAALPDKKARRKLIVNFGTRDSIDYLNRIKITKAREVYIIGDDSEFDEIENYHDALNIECVNLIAKLCKEQGRKGLPCNVSFSYKTTYHVFQYADLPSSITDYIRFHPFNFCELWAQKVLVANTSPNEGIMYKPLDYKPITSKDSGDYIHLIVICLSPMGQAIALQAAHIAHYPNYKKRKTRITIIDSNMRKEMDEFKQKCGELFEVSYSEYIDADKWVETGEKQIEKYHINEKEYGHLVTNPSDPDFTDIEWCFINGDDGNPKVRQLLEEYISDDNAIITVAVCLNIAHRSLRSAMRLPKTYYEKNIPILVQQRKTETVVDTLNGKNLAQDIRKNLLYKNILPFGMVYDCYDFNLVKSMRLCKRINAAYKYYYQNGECPASIDDKYADELWEDLVTSKRWSNIFSAASIPTKLRCIGYSTEKMHIDGLNIDNLNDNQIQMLSEMEHNRWVITQLLLGYRPVTAKEDIEIDNDKSKKLSYKNRYIHYDIRPYDGLKTDEKGNKAGIYDELIIRCIPLIANTIH